MFPYTKPPPGVQINWGHPLAKGLVGCWLFNEGSGLRVNDLSGKGNHGVLTNFEPFSAVSGWKGGKIGTTLWFNGAANHVRIPDDLVHDIFTFVGRIKLDPAYPIDARYFFSTGNYTFGVGNMGIHGYVDSDKRVRFRTTTDIAQDTPPPTVPFVTDVEYQVAFVKEGALGIVYINGNAVASHPTLNTVSNSTLNLTTFGMNTSAIRFFFGTISPSFVWNGRALNAFEIQQLYAQPFSMLRWNPKNALFRRKHG